jgi:hypothetical protein
MIEEILGGLFLIIGISVFIFAVSEMDFYINRLPISTVLKKIFSMLGVLIMMTVAYYGLTYLETVV